MIMLYQYILASNDRDRQHAVMYRIMQVNSKLLYLLKFQLSCDICYVENLASDCCFSDFAYLPEICKCGCL